MWLPPINTAEGETQRPISKPVLVSRMKLFVQAPDGRRAVMHIPGHCSIGHFKKLVQKRIAVETIGSSGDEQMVLNYAGADLDEQWTFCDIGIPTGSTMKIVYREQKFPDLLVDCSFNKQVIELERLDLLNTTIQELRGIITRRLGIPISVFRLETAGGQEMFDCHYLKHYNVEKGGKIYLQIWDGWAELLNAGINAATKKVLNRRSKDDLVARFQIKTALYIASHYGHLEMAVTLLELGLRADEPIGYHPYRYWCRDDTDHPDVRRAPVHVATEAGNLEILTMFVHQNICCLLARDGYGLAAWNIALRHKLKKCARFLLMKQWSKIPFSTANLPLYVFNGLRRWAEGARERISLVVGASSSQVAPASASGDSGVALLTARRSMEKGALVGIDMCIDGFSAPRMNSRPADAVGDARLRSVASSRARAEATHQLAQQQLSRSLARLRDAYVRRRNDQQPIQITVAQIERTKDHKDKEKLKDSDAQRLARDKVATVSYVTKTLPIIVEDWAGNSSGDSHGDGSRGDDGDEALLSDCLAWDNHVEKADDSAVVRRRIKFEKSLTSVEKNSSASEPQFVQRSKTLPSLSSSERSQLSSARRASVVRSHLLDQFAAYQSHLFGVDSQVVSDRHKLAATYLRLASSFSQKPWMQQVNIALRLSENKVKRPRPLPSGVSK